VTRVEKKQASACFFYTADGQCPAETSGALSGAPSLGPERYVHAQEIAATPVGPPHDWSSISIFSIDTPASVIK
jgi:hypothetical protein